MDLSHHPTSTATATGKAEAATSRAKQSVRELNKEHERLVEKQLALQRAGTIAECINALKSFTTADLGHTHPRGGTAKHIEARMEVLERLRRRGSPLPAEQANDWEWFKRRWDAARLTRLGDKHRCTWGATFHGIAMGLMDRIRGGELDAVSRWMAAEAKEYLAIPTLRL